MFYTHLAYWRQIYMQYLAMCSKIWKCFNCTYFKMFKYLQTA